MFQHEANNTRLVCGRAVEVHDVSDVGEGLNGFNAVEDEEVDLMHGELIILKHVDEELRGKVI